MRRTAPAPARDRPTSPALPAKQIDYHDGILEWFGHYLKDGGTPAWFEKGVSVLDRERELKRKKKETAKETVTAGAWSGRLQRAMWPEHRLSICGKLDRL